MSNEEPDEIFIGCMSVQLARWNPGCVVPGCVIKRCYDCGTDIHVSPSSQKLTSEKPEIHLACIPCLQKNAKREMAKGEIVAFMGVVPGAVKEMMDNIARKKEEKP